MASKTFGKDDDAEDPLAAKLAELDRLIEEQRARLATMSGGISADAKAIIEAQRENQKEVIAATRQVRHSNPDHAHISAFSYPEGDLARPKKLKWKEVFHNGHREREDDLTPGEVDAYNAITHSCEARGGRWQAKVTSDGKRLLVTIPCYTPDERGDIPSLTLQLYELAQGERAVAPDQMIAELQRLRKAVEASGIVVPG